MILASFLKVEYLLTLLTIGGGAKSPCLSKKPLKTQKKSKELEIMYQNVIYIFIFWYSKICWFPVKKCWCR